MGGGSGRATVSPMRVSGTTGRTSPGMIGAGRKSPNMQYNR